MSTASPMNEAPAASVGVIAPPPATLSLPRSSQVLDGKRVRSAHRTWADTPPPLLQELTCHHEALDLVGALVDLGDLRVPHHPLDRVVLDVPVAAEHLHGVRRDLHGDVRGVALRR